VGAILRVITGYDARQTAAALLTRSPEPLRKELMGMLEPYMAANIVQVRSFSKMSA
jgi:hypothetical protein